MLEHALVILSSTMTAARFNNNPLNMTCSLTDTSCKQADTMSTLNIAMFPVVIAFLVLVVIHLSLPFMPTCEKIHQLQNGTSRLLLLVYPISLLLFTFEHYPALTTTTVLHAVSFILWDGLQTHNPFHILIFTAGLIILLLWTWQEGLPMPVFETPGVSIGCSTKAHLTGIVSSRIVLSCIQWATKQTLLN